MLFSRMDSLSIGRPILRKNQMAYRKIEIESTEMGIEAATVSPAFNPTYTVTAPKMIPKTDPRISARADSSLGLSSADTKGRKVVVVVAIRQNLLANQVKGCTGVYQCSL